MTTPSSSTLVRPVLLAPALPASKHAPRLPVRRYTEPPRGAHSSSGLGHRPLTAAARVRIPYAPFGDLAAGDVTTTLETPRLTLRVPRLEDADAFFAGFLDDLEVMEFL